MRDRLAIAIIVLGVVLGAMLAVALMLLIGEFYA